MIQNFRDHAANERTFLAWVRTSIAVIAFGFLVERFDLLLVSAAPASLKNRASALQEEFGRLVGLVLIVLGVVMILIAVHRFVRTAKEIDDQGIAPGTGSRTDLALASLLVILIGALLFYLVHNLAAQTSDRQVMNNALTLGSTAMTADGLIEISSDFEAADTMNRLEAEVKAKGMTVFARVDHAGGARAVGLSLRPTELLIFGNAKGGTPLMEANQEIGLDLPLKVLVYQDAAGKVWLAYSSPSWLAERYDLPNSVAANVSALETMLKAVTDKTAKPS
jgi:uncharacterized protein (DUF302 family)/uncharacterized membrane protein YidH (DUF202 family)